MNKNAPLIVQGDGTILLDVSAKDFEEIRNFMLVFAELIKSPEYIHTYRITLVSLWNAASLNYTSESIIDFLKKYTSYEIPKNIIKQIETSIEKYGRVKIIREEEKYYLISEDKDIIEEVLHYKAVMKYLKEKAPKIDLALFPVDRRMGKDYMKGAKQFIEQIKTTIFVPMHFSEDYEGGNALRDFAENAGCRFVSITHRGESFEITK